MLLKNVSSLCPFYYTGQVNSKIKIMIQKTILKIIIAYNNGPNYVENLTPEQSIDQRYIKFEIMWVSFKNLRVINIDFGII